MSYVIFLMAISFFLATVSHLYLQFSKTARIRQALHEARTDKRLTGLHSLRRDKN